MCEVSALVCSTFAFLGEWAKTPCYATGRVHHLGTTLLGRLRWYPAFKGQPSERARPGRVLLMSVGGDGDVPHVLAGQEMNYFKCVGPYLVHSKSSRNVSCAPSRWILLKPLVRTT